MSKSRANYNANSKAKTRRTNGELVSVHKNKTISWSKAEVLTIITESGKERDILYIPFLNDVIPVAVPQLGVPEQDKNRIFALPTSDSVKADLKTDFVSIPALTSAFNKIADGRKWSEVIESARWAEKQTKNKETGAVVRSCRYVRKTSKDANLSKKEKRVAVWAEKYFNGIERKVAKRLSTTAKETKVA